MKDDVSYKFYHIKQVCMLDLFFKVKKKQYYAGSIPESLDGSIYNTCSVFSPSGDMIGKYQKMHLFDIDVPGKIRFQESEVLKGGNKLFSFQVGKFNSLIMFASINKYLKGISTSFFVSL